MAVEMLKDKILLLGFSFFFFFFNFVDGSEQSTKERMKGDLDIIRNVFEVGYAPKEWKKICFGWDLEDEINKAKAKIDGASPITIKAYHNIVRDFFLSVNDYHVNVFFWSTEEAHLPFLIQSVNKKYFITHVDNERLSSSTCPLSTGDEIVSFNGQPIHEAVQAFKKLEMRDANDTTDNTFAELFFTHRLGVMGHRVPRGPVMVGIKSSAKVRNHQLIWHYIPEKMSNGLKSEGQKKDKITQGKTKDLLLKAIDEKKMISPYYEFVKNRLFLSRCYRDSDDDYEGDSEDDDLEDLDQEQGLLGTRKGFLPELGRIWWESDPKSFFHAYIYENEDHHLIGYVRIPHYLGDNKEIKEFAKIVDTFEERVDAMMIDQTNNPGGSLFFAYALAAMLTEEPLVTPKDRMAITQADVVIALEIIKDLEKISTDNQAKKVLGRSFFGFPVNHQLVQFFLEYFRFIVSEWSRGHTLTDPHYVYCVDQINPNRQSRFTKPLIILINNMAISCGDLFPAIMQDNKRAILAGQKTSGAGGSLSGMMFPNRYGIQYFSYTGSISERIDSGPIENTGVVPDVPYAITEDDVKEGYCDYAKALNKMVKDMLDRKLTPDIVRKGNDEKEAEEMLELAELNNDLEKAAEERFKESPQSENSAVEIEEIQGENSSGSEALTIIKTLDLETIALLRILCQNVFNNIT